MRSDLLHVVTVYFNPIRWDSRLRLYKDFEQHMLDCGVRLTTVECQLGERPFELGDNPHITHVPVRAKTILWNKESLLRIGMSRLPDPDWKYVCWSDSDIFFRKSDWAYETVHALQQYDVVQPWSDAYDLGPGDSHLAVYKSFLHQYWHGHSVVYGVAGHNSHFEKRVRGLENSQPHPKDGVPAISQELIAQQVQQHLKHGPHPHGPHKPHPTHPPHGPHDPKNPNGTDPNAPCPVCPPCPPCPPVPPYYGFVSQIQAAKMPWWKRDGGPHEYPHTGYVWAARRSVIDGVGGLFDIAAMGAGDYHMALALCGYADRSIPGKVSESYRKHLMAWEERAFQHVNFNLGYIPGTIEHSFHGSKGHRRYIDRWQIILEHDFDPDTDILRNAHGVFELRCTKPKLRHDLDVYFRQRNEDANIL